MISSFMWHRTNADVSDGDKPSLTVSDSHAPAVFTPAIAQSNRGREGDVFETVRAGSHGALPMVAVSVAQNQRGELGTAEIAAQLTSGGGKPGEGYPAVFLPSVVPTLGKESYSPTKSSSGQMIDFSIGSPFGVRRLTPRECERLQGFPDDWTVEQTDSARYRQLGNAVCVNVAEWIGNRIVAYEAQL